MHTGVKGYVKSINGQPLEGATITVSDRQHPVTTATDGDYWRLLVPGSYEIQAAITGYKPQRKVIEVHSDHVSLLDFNLKPSHDEGELDEADTGVSCCSNAVRFSMLICKVLASSHHSPMVSNFIFLFSVTYIIILTVLTALCSFFNSRFTMIHEKVARELGQRLVADHETAIAQFPKIQKEIFQKHLQMRMMTDHSKQIQTSRFNFFE